MILGVEIKGLSWKVRDIIQLEIAWFNTLTGKISDVQQMAWSNYFTLVSHFKDVDNILIIKTK